MPKLFTLVAAFTACVLGAAAPAAAQPLKVVAVPALATPRNVETDAGETGVIGVQIAQLIATDLRQSGAAFTTGPEKMRAYSPTEAGAPQYALWTGSGASALVTGYVERRSDGRLAVICYLYDLKERRELTRKGFAVQPSEWRRAGHRCADAIYLSLTGTPGHFDSRIAYVAETGTSAAPVKRLAVMDFDGTNHEYLTAGEVTVLSPRLSPDGRSVAYVSFSSGQPHVRIRDLGSEADRPLVPEPPRPFYTPTPFGMPPGFAPPPPQPAMSFAPAFSPDGRRIVFAMAQGGNTDIYIVDVDGGQPQRLTSAPGIDTSPSFSPDGRRIVFESDRSGSQQLYVMDVRGSGERRISFGSGSYASPVWSPDGEAIAFARIMGGRIRVGVMNADGGDDRIVTDGWQDEGPSWSPGGRHLMFHRTEQGNGRTALYVAALAGGEPRRVAAPQGGSDPAWAPPQ